MILVTAKQAPKKAVPFGGRGTAVAVEGGGLASYLDCLTTNAPTPTTAVQKNSIKSEWPYNIASNLPLSEPSRAHLSPKGEALIYAVGACTTVLTLLANITGNRSL